MDNLPVVEPGPELDLHPFRPCDVGAVLEEYLRVAVERGWPAVRIIHGRGRMVLARSVHAILRRHPAVQRYEWSSGGPGGAGATMAWLRLVCGESLGGAENSEGGLPLPDKSV